MFRDFVSVARPCCGFPDYVSPVPHSALPSKSVDTVSKGLSPTCPL